MQLYKGCPIDIPVYISLGVSNKKRRYEVWLESCIENESNDPDKSRRLGFIAFIHKVGLKNRSIVLQSDHALWQMQVEAVKEFLIKHKEFLDSVLPYLFPDELRVSDKI